MTTDARSTDPVIAVLVDVVGSRTLGIDHVAWLEDLAESLNVHYSGRGNLLADFARTRGDEIEGLLAVGADPFDAILLGSLGHRVGTKVVPVRWVAAAGMVRAGSGPASRRDGQALWAAQDALTALRERDAEPYGIELRTGSPSPDEILSHLVPWISEELRGLTDNQRRLIAQRLRAETAAMTLAKLRFGAKVDVSLEAVRKTLASSRVRRFDDLVAVARVEWKRGAAVHAPDPLRASARS